MNTKRNDVLYPETLKCTAGTVNYIRRFHRANLLYLIRF